MSNRPLILKILLPILLLLLGVAVSLLLFKSRQAPPQQEAPFRGVLVETLTVAQGDHRLAIRATGTVQARTEAEIVPQVSGKVVRVAPSLVAGGFLRAGEELFAIEAIDFELAVEKAAANLSKAELDLETVQAQADIAREEWARLNPGQEPNPLVVYTPQLKTAEAARSAARAALNQAGLDLQRTQVTAPFNGFVRSEQVDLGQYVKSGTRVATLTGTDEVEIVVPLSLADLHWLDVPRQPDRQGSPASVTLRTDERSWQWSGWVARSLGEVDPRGRMARVAVVVADPYGLRDAKAAGPELAIGSFVEVTLQGRTLSQVVELPRSALRDGDTVWVMTADRQLKIVPVEVVRREQAVALIAAGLAGGEQVVVTPISGAADGLLLRVAEP